MSREWENEDGEREKERGEERRGEGKEASKMNSIRLLFKSDHLFTPGQQSQSVSLSVLSQSVSQSVLPSAATDLAPVLLLQVVQLKWTTRREEKSKVLRATADCTANSKCGIARRSRIHVISRSGNITLISNFRDVRFSGKVDVPRGQRRRREKGIALRPRY